MQQTRLKIFARIKGIHAASALCLKGHLLYIISDNSNYLYEYHIENKLLNKIPLLETVKPGENIPKSEKPDFENLCHFGNSLFILGSGSTAKRNKMVEFRTDTRQLSEYDLLPIYTAMKSAHAIDDEDFNIEGAVFTGSKWYLFNRGNGSAMKNGIFIVHSTDLATAKSADFTAIPLLKIGKVLVSFTDAVLYESKIYFVAAAEDSVSTYNDGKIMGSYLGCLDPLSLKVDFIKKIAEHQKFEGISIFDKGAEKPQFLLCEDADVQTPETLIYTLDLRSL